MASRLSSLLVRDGLVGVKRMEKAFQRQVIYGGALDTILLEMNLVPEERLLQYLALATGLPPALTEETNIFSPDAIKKCPAVVATAHDVVPLSFQDGALRVLVRDPVDLSRLEELANDLDLPIQPLVTTEYRYFIVKSHAYGGTLDARYAALARQVEELQASVVPVGRSQTVIVAEAIAESESNTDRVVVDVALPPSAGATVSRASTIELGTKAFRDAEAQRAPATPPATPPADAAGPSEATTDGSRVPRVAGTARPDSDHDTAGIPQPIDPSLTPPPSMPAIAATPTAKPAPTMAERHATDMVTPLSAVAAREAMADATQRDEVFAILLRAVRGCAWYAGLLTVQGGAAIGRLAIIGDTLDRESIAGVLIPLDGDHPIHRAVEKGVPHIGPIETGDEAVDRMISRMGNTMPPSALVLPIVLRKRVVALVIGHRGGESLGVPDVSELLPLARAAADALGRLIVAAKSAGPRDPDATPRSQPAPTAKPSSSGPAPQDTTGGAAPPEPARVATAEFSTRNQTSSAIGAAPAQIVVGAKDGAAAEPPRARRESQFDAAATLTIAETATDSEAAQRAFDALLDHADEALPTLNLRFPGTLKMTRYDAAASGARVGQFSVVLDLVTRIGAATSELILDRMRDSNDDIRYFATMCAAEVRPRDALHGLVERLFDVDRDVRARAIDALNGYPSRELDAGLLRARHALHSEDPDRVEAAAQSLAELGDVAAIPDLLESLGRGQRHAEASKHALSTLTKQDFGTNARKWRGWWDKNKQRNRVEWLIDALSHKSEDLRRSAVESLRLLTGEYFGYHHDLPKKEREAAKERWSQWWNDEGRKRFIRAESPRRATTVS